MRQALDLFPRKSERVTLRIGTVVITTLIDCVPVFTSATVLRAGELDVEWLEGRQKISKAELTSLGGRHAVNNEVQERSAIMR